MPRAMGYAALAAGGLLGGCVQPPLLVAGPPSYCYRTLADVDCYLEPMPTGRLVGASVPMAPLPAYYPLTFYPFYPLSFY